MITHAVCYYRIPEKLAAGELGEVYRTPGKRRDPEVGIHVVPSAFVADEKARKGLRKEALTGAADFPLPDSTGFWDQVIKREYLEKFVVETMGELLRMAGNETLKVRPLNDCL